MQVGSGKTDGSITIEKRGHVGLLSLSRPQSRNAWGQDFTDELPRILVEWADDPDIRCVVVTGDEAGGAFSAGADMKNPQTHAERTPGEFVSALKKPRSWVTSVPEEFPKPVIAAVNGYAIGNGCIFSFSCDLIVASERAEWRLPQASLGILPANGGSVRLAKLIGKGNAMRMALGFPLSAQEAMQAGLAQWLFLPHHQLMERTFEIAEKIAQLPPLAARLVGIADTRSRRRHASQRRLGRRLPCLRAGAERRHQGNASRVARSVRRCFRANSHKPRSKPRRRSTNTAHR